MAPYEIKNAVLKQLREARASLLGLDYLLALEQRSPAEQKAAALQLSNVQLAYLRLRKAQLADIRARLEANEDDLTSSIESLQEALKDLKKVEQIVGAVAGFLEVVGRVVTLL